MFQTDMERNHSQECTWLSDRCNELGYTEITSFTYVFYYHVQDTPYLMLFFMLLNEAVSTVCVTCELHIGGEDYHELSR